MNWINDHLLSIILFFPAMAALGMLVLPGRRPGLLRWYTLIATLVPLIFSIFVWLGFTPGQTGFQLEECAPWFPQIHSSYHLGIDGISLAMVLLTTILFPLAILASFKITEKLKAYLVLFLLLETGILGVFLVLDLLLFFVFWEIGLVPMYFLINLWGSQNRNYASLKFILYTMAGSLGLLLAIQVMGVASGTYDLVLLFERWTALSTPIFGIPIATVKGVAFWAFVVAFAVKVPVWPFHTWLPDAHTEAPTAGSMILAGLLLKLGAYGFLRLVLPLFPEEAHTYAGALALFATLAIVLGAFAAYGQDDFKRLVAYSSINHMGFVVLGIAVAARAVGTAHADSALNGAVLQMFSHGLSAAGMFFLVGVLYDRAHTRDLGRFGGLMAELPIYGGILIFIAMASLGLPGLSGFIAEFMVVRGALPVFTLATAVSMLGLLFTGVYVLKALKKVLQGPLNPEWRGHLAEISPREVLVVAPLMALSFWLGIWPGWLIKVINDAVLHFFS